MDLIETSNDLAVERIQADAKYICDEIPSRLAGSENGRRMAEYSCEGLKASGIDAKVHTLPGLVSFPNRGKLRLIGSDEYEFPAFTLGHSVQTPQEGVTAEVVDAGGGAYSDYANKDVHGKIVLVELSYHPGRHEKQRIAAEKGAIGCIMMNWGAAHNDELPYGSVKPAWGNPTPETYAAEMASLPCIGVSHKSGLHLRQLLAAGKVRVILHTSVENSWKPIHMTTGELRAENSDDFVLIGGHQDSWEGPQATDNAVGSAIILELARLFSKHRGQLRRGISFGLWTAHETGTMIGSTWYVDTNWDRLRKHGVAYLQIDQPACAGTSRWGSVSNSELRQFQEDLDKHLLGDKPRAWRRTVKVGDASFFGVGVPMLAGQGVFTPEELKATANASFGWWHHTLENTLDKVAWNDIALHLKMYVSYVWGLCTSPVIPCTFMPVAEEISKRINELCEAGTSIGLESVAQLANELVQATKRFDAHAALINERCLKGENEAEQEARVLNEVIKRLSRLLLPIVGTAKGVYGHDPYAYTPQTTVLPSLYDVPQLETLAEGEQRWMLETKLVRERNRIADVLHDAIAAITAVLPQR